MFKTTPFLLVVSAMENHAKRVFLFFFSNVCAVYHKLFILKICIVSERNHSDELLNWRGQHSCNFKLILPNFLIKKKHYVF